MNDFPLCSFVSNVCKLLCSKSRIRGVSYDREECAQTLLASAAERPWWAGCNRSKWKDPQWVNKEGMEFKEGLSWQIWFVCIIASQAVSFLHPYVSYICIKDHSQQALRASSWKGRDHILSWCKLMYQRQFISLYRYYFMYIYVEINLILFQLSFHNFWTLVMFLTVLHYWPPQIMYLRLHITY